MKKINGKSPLIQILTLCAGILFSINVQAQNNWITLPNGKKLSDKDGPKKYYYEIKNGETKTLKVEDPNEVVKVIVALKDKPLALYKSKNVLRKISLTSVLSSLKQTHSAVSAKIKSLAGKLSAGTNFQYKVDREYFTALNGMAVECNRWMMQYIRELPEVKNVWLDRKVKATWINSDKQIRADVVQDSLGYTGKGVLIGEIDTGIDYTNPLLGGSFGPGYRVIGGYDFVNNDNDPYDDMGHGTHVAGILGASGDSIMVGVAPDVKFLAVKVLDNNGIGMWSDVITGIEYCMDPDGNPNTDDAVDIINMSLGSTPIPDNPVDQAVDNATQAGILSVVAAGNSGNDPIMSSFKTIDSPGTAESALTVGACNSADHTADFSSRGPDAIHYAIKPEVSAPGVNILSILPNNKTASWDGTSMATPQVAGVAALLKQEHPNWTPGQLKAAIVNSAKSTPGESIFAQGNGRVDALNAANLGITVEPGVFNFGLVDLHQSVWIDTLQFKVKNLRGISQNFNLMNKSSLPAGVTLDLSQTNFQLAPLQEKEITAIISVSQSVPIISIDPFSYTGNIICQSDSDSVRVPFNFVKSNVLLLELDIPPTLLFLYYGTHGKSIAVSDQWGQSDKYTLAVGKRDFTLWAWFATTDTILKRRIDYFISKNINADGFTYITVDHNEAKYHAFNGLNSVRDRYNNPVSIPDSTSVTFNFDIYDPGYTVFRGVAYLSFPKKLANIYMNSMDKRFKIYQDILINHGNQSLWLSKYTVGVKSQDDLTFFTGPDNLGDLHLNFDYKKRSPARPYVQSDAITVFNNFEGGYNFTISHSLPNIPYIHFMASKLPTDFNPMSYLATSIGIKIYGSNVTSDFFIDKNRDFVFFDRKFFRTDKEDYVKILTHASGDTMTISQFYNDDIRIPKFQFLYQYYNSGDLGLTQFSPDAFDDGGVSFSDGMHVQGDLGTSLYITPGFTARMYSRNRLIKDNRVPSYFFMFYYDYNVMKNSNRYRLLTTTPPYKILGQNGEVTTDYEFKVTDPTAYGKSFMPSMDWFQILENGKVTHWIHPGNDDKIRLVIFDPKDNLDSVDVSLLKNDGSEIRLTTTKTSPKEYFASIPDSIPSGFLDVIARVHNTEGNKFEYTVSPAFYSGSTLDSNYDARLQMINQTLDNVDSVEFVTGDTLNYNLTFNNYGNIIAKDITVNFPQTDYFSPVGNTSATIDSMSVDVQGSNNKYEIPLKLLFLGKKQPDEKQRYYSPTVTWKSGERTFTRKYKILVDFENTITDVKNFKKSIPNTYALSQNFPNPFNPRTKIDYSIPQNSFVSIKVYDILGNEIATLVNEEKPAGNYIIEFDGSKLASGIYFYRMQSGSFAQVKKLVLLK